jgi:hypothetical protein
MHNILASILKSTRKAYSVCPNDVAIFLPEFRFLPIREQLHIDYRVTPRVREQLSGTYRQKKPPLASK